MLENTTTVTCRFCQFTFENAAKLYDHYMEWHCDVPVKFLHCFICNFKSQDQREFISHVFKKHMRCACGAKFSSFNSTLEHVKSCLKNCPYCRKKFKFEALVKHINKDQSSLTCPFCHGSEQLDQLKKHIHDCILKISIGVMCPICRHYQFQNAESLKTHILQSCRPWSSTFGHVQCASGSEMEKMNISLTNVIKLEDIVDSLNFRD